MGTNYQKLFTRSGHELHHAVSALQKCIRRGVEYEACWFAIDICEGGFDQKFWQRMTMIAAEDIGLADPYAMTLVNSCRESWMAYRKMKDGKPLLPERNIVCLAVLYFCRAPKNREADDLAFLIESKNEGRDPKTWEKGKMEKLPIPSEAMDQHTGPGKAALRRRVKETGVTEIHERCREFYAADGKPGVAGLNKPANDPRMGDKDWRVELLKWFDFPDVTPDAYLTPANELTFNAASPKVQASKKSKKVVVEEPMKEAEAKPKKVKEEKSEDEDSGVWKKVNGTTVTKNGSKFIVQTIAGKYDVDVRGKTCTCENFQDEGECKHLNLVKDLLSEKTNEAQIDF